MKIKISKKLQLKEYYAEMTLGRASNRSDYVAYAKLATELGGMIDADKLCHLFLRDLKKKVGTEILVECCNNGIFYWDSENDLARLTKIGQDTAKNGIAYLEEHDVYFLAFLNEPILEKSLLACHPIKNSSNRIAERGNNHSSGCTLNIPLHQELTPFTEKKPDDPDNGWIKNSIRIYEITPGKTFELCPEISLDLKIELSDFPPEGRIKISGFYEDSQSLNENNHLFEEIFAALKEISEFQKWDDRKNALIT